MVGEKNLSPKYAPQLAIEIVRFLVLIISKLFWRIAFHGTENIPQALESGLLVVSNHQTYLDPFWVCLPIKRKLRFMAWNKAFGWFLIGDLIRFLEAFPVNLERGGKQAVIEAIKALKDHATLMMFPKGSRFFPTGNFCLLKQARLESRRNQKFRFCR